MILAAKKEHYNRSDIKRNLFYNPLLSKNECSSGIFSCCLWAILLLSVSKHLSDFHISYLLNQLSALRGKKLTFQKKILFDVRNPSRSQRNIYSCNNFIIFINVHLP